MKRVYEENKKRGVERLGQYLRKLGLFMKRGVKLKVCHKVDESVI